MANVPVNDINPIHQYVATAGQTDFVFTYVIYETSDIKVYLNDVLKTETTDYTVKNSDGSNITADDLADGLSGGKVVFNTGLALNDNVTLFRDIPAERTTGFTTSGALTADALNLALNKIIALIQQVQRDGDRTIRQSPSDTGASPIELPPLDTRKGKYMFFNNTTGVPEAGPGASVGDYAVSEFGQGLIDDADAAAAFATLGISAFAQTLLDDADAATARSTLGILLPKQITIANGTDADHDIDFTAGTFDFDDQSGQATLSTITKQIDAPWAEGTNAGGLDTGTVAADTFYYLFAIYNPTTQTSDALFSASKTSPTLPSGYTKKKYVGTVYTNGSASIWGFYQAGNMFFYIGNQIITIDYSGPTSKTSIFVPGCPPNAVALIQVMLFMANNTSSQGIYIWTPQSDITNFSYNLINNNPNGQASLNFLIKTDSSSQVDYYWHSTHGTRYLECHGFIDPEL